MATATLRRDPISHYAWLDFGGYPGNETHATLKAAGWRWSRYRSQYYTNRRYAAPPAGIGYEDGGTCDYSAERADRLEVRADAHEDKAAAAQDRAHAIGDMIPFGQPVLVGHHSEGRHRRDLARIDSAMCTAVEESGEAKRLDSAAQSSRLHQQHIQSAPAIARRIARLEAEIRKLERDRKYWIRKDTGGVHERWTLMHETTTRELNEARAALAETGGIAADHVEIHVGDIVDMAWCTLEVTRVNRKTISGKHVDGPFKDWARAVDRSKFRRVIHCPHATA